MANKIQPVQIWLSGQIVEAQWLVCTCIQDNLNDSAVFQYQLYTDSDNSIGYPVSQGTVTMNEPEYSGWVTNEYAYNFVADQLSLTIIS